LSPAIKTEFDELYEELININKRVAGYDKKIERISESFPEYSAIKQIKGIGTLTASAIIGGVPDPSIFKNGRQFSAWIGLVPLQNSTGGKQKLLGISKKGDRYLRTLLIHGARSTVWRAKEKDDPLSKWVQSVSNRRGANKAAVALANKNARLVWSALFLKEKFKYRA
jgi:transposase